MPFSQRNRTRASESAARSPWSTEPELPPDVGARLVELAGTTRTLMKELALELDDLRPLLAVEPSAQSDYVSAIRRLAAAEQTALDVNAALKRLDDGTYGLCAACTDPVPPARLELLPHTRTCVACS